MDAKENSKKKQLAPPKLKLLFTIVNREKTELYTALIQGFNVNMQLSTAARGTASREIMQMLGLSDKNKSLIVSVTSSMVKTPRFSHLTRQVRLQR